MVYAGGVNRQTIAVYGEFRTEEDGEFRLQSRYVDGGSDGGWPACAAQTGLGGQGRG